METVREPSLSNSSKRSFSSSFVIGTPFRMCCTPRRNSFLVRKPSPSWLRLGSGLGLRVKGWGWGEGEGE
eukprot:scaffold104336_cov63-Phaeocystis_antarctica.AAC.1